MAVVVPIPTPIVRFVHTDNLYVIMKRGGCHAPNFTPKDRLEYKPIHNLEVQQKRANRKIPCGLGGVIHDYVAFYFGALSPMMLNLKTGRVAGYTDGQEALIYLTANAQKVADSGAAFVFSDGHGIAAYTSWFDQLEDLDKIDWSMVNQRYRTDKANDMDRQRKKQAEFLVYQFCNWSLIRNVTLMDDVHKSQVEKVFKRFPSDMHRPVHVRQDWYYY